MSNLPPGVTGCEPEIAAIVREDPMSTEVERIRAEHEEGWVGRDPRAPETDDVASLLAAYDEQAERIARLEAERRGLWEDVEAWRTASGLVGVHPNGCEGDPGDVEPRHLQAYLDAQEARVERLRAVALGARYMTEARTKPAEEHAWHLIDAALRALHPGDLSNDAPTQEADE